uniref:Uncharacterized protein n=1 Tax=Haptolina ericina TaxID=156174 RepID=A0A7S3ASZ9_9EUKA|mmetsp:Transcript_34249/g.77608  ORF Transcript_34249/g.77608 Transcript_34249/m.77608 type:complete len:358 (+) Transcript_34249:647-1720(+)
MHQWAERRSTEHSIFALREELSTLRQQVEQLSLIVHGRTAPKASPLRVLDGRVHQTQWTTPVVLVVTTLNGTVADKHPSWQNTSQATVLIFQRLRPDAPNYVVNLAYEAGVHIKFLVDNYDDLPNVTVFLQADARRHNRKVFEWLHCLRTNATQPAYAPLMDRRWIRRDMRVWDDCCDGAAVVEQCWRDVLAVVGLGGLLPDGQRPSVGYYPGASFVATAAQLRRHSRGTYTWLHSMAAGSDGRCHVGPLEWSKLNATRRNGSLELDTVGMHQHTFPGAWEHLVHVIIGGQYRDKQQDVRRGEGLWAPYAHDFCGAFRDGCDGSPCDVYRSWQKRNQLGPRTHKRQVTRRKPSPPGQ